MLLPSGSVRSARKPEPTNRSALNRVLFTSKIRSPGESVMLLLVVEVDKVVGDIGKIAGIPKLRLAGDDVLAARVLQGEVRISRQWTRGIVGGQLGAIGLAVLVVEGRENDRCRQTDLRQSNCAPTCNKCRYRPSVASITFCSPLSHRHNCRRSALTGSLVGLAALRRSCVLELRHGLITH